MILFSWFSFLLVYLLTYKNATDFWILVLYTAILLNLVISFSNLLMESLVFSMYSIMSSADKDSFTSSFPIWMSFISSSCLIAVARTSTTMLHMIDKNRHPCLVSDLKGNTCSFCPLSMMLAVGLSYIAYIMLRYVPSTSTLQKVFIINGCWILSKPFSATIEMIMWFLVFILFMCYITFINLQILYQLCIP